MPKSKGGEQTAKVCAWGVERLVITQAIASRKPRLWVHADL